MTASILSRIITRRNEVEYENNLNAARKRGEEIAMANGPEFCGYAVCGDRGGPAEACGARLPCAIREHNDFGEDAAPEEVEFPELGDLHLDPVAALRELRAATPSCGYSVCIAIGQCRNDHPGNRGVQWRAVQSTGGMWFLWRGTSIVDAGDGDVEWDAIGPLDMLPQNYIHGDRHTGINAHSCCVHDPLIGCCDNHPAPPSPDVNHACPVHGWEHDYRRCPLIASSATEPSEKLTEEMLKKIDGAAQDCEDPRCACGTKVDAKTMRALVAAARERNRYASGDYVREQSDKLAQAEKMIAERAERIAILEADANERMRSRHLAILQLLRATQMSEPPSTAPDQLVAMAALAAHQAKQFHDGLHEAADEVRNAKKLVAELGRANSELATDRAAIEEQFIVENAKVRELEQHIADARKECERALRSHPLLIEDLHSDLQRIATILEPPAGGDTKG